MNVLIVFGTRPELIKFVPVIYTLRDFHHLTVVHTLQHDELTEDILTFFKITPDFKAPNVLKISNKKTAEHRFEGDLPDILRTVKPDIVLVQGDTLTAFLGALVSFEMKIPVLHLEAGLRTGNRFSPYPEEIYRMMISQIADFHFAPTELAAKELINSRIPRDRVYVAGNTVIDAALLTSAMLDEESKLRALDSVCSDLNIETGEKDLVIITTHRAENIGEPLKRICQSIVKLSNDYPKMHFLWLLHRNPNVRKIIQAETAGIEHNICFIEAVSYPLMIWLMKWAKCILTDSGGIQEEATALHVPIIILREHTERPEALKVINAHLVGTNIDLIRSAFHSMVNGNRQMINQPSPFGDGKTSLRLKQFLDHPETVRFLKEYPESGNFILSNSEDWIKVDV